MNDDSIVESVHAGEYGLYDDSLKTLYKATQTAILTHALAMKKPVIVDTGSRTRAARARWVSLAHSLDVPVYAIVFPKSTPDVHAWRRMLSDGRDMTYDDWVKVAEHHDRLYESVDYTEGFDGVMDVTFRSVDKGDYFDPNLTKQAGVTV